MLLHITFVRLFLLDKMPSHGLYIVSCDINFFSLYQIWTSEKW